MWHGFQEPHSIREPDGLGQPACAFDAGASDVDAGDSTAVAPGKEAGGSTECRAQVDNDARRVDPRVLGECLDRFDSAVMILVEIEEVLRRELGEALAPLRQRPKDATRSWDGCRRS